MQVDNERLKSFALDAGLVNEEQIGKAIEESAKTGKKLGDVLVEQKLVNADQLRQLFAYILGIPFVNIEKEIIPALEKGIIVISDRYMYSSLAFGSIDCDIEWLKGINAKFLKPDVSIILKVSPDISLERIGHARAGFELFEDKAKLENVRSAFEILAKEISGITVIDGTMPVNKVSMAIVHEVQKVL